MACKYIIRNKFTTNLYTINTLMTCKYKLNGMLMLMKLYKPGILYVYFACHLHIVSC